MNTPDTKLALHPLLPDAADGLAANLTKLAEAMRTGSDAAVVAHLDRVIPGIDLVNHLIEGHRAASARRRWTGN